MLIAALFIIIFACLAGVLILRLAIYALPLWCGGAVGWWAHDNGGSLATALPAGLAAATAILIIGHLLLGAAKSPLFRAGVGLAFAVPAAIAGYHAAHGITAAFGVEGWPRLVMCGLAAATTGSAAWIGIFRSRGQSHPAVPNRVGRWLGRGD
jgi:hypothetical protein